MSGRLSIRLPAIESLSLAALELSPSTLVSHSRSEFLMLLKHHVFQQGRADELHSTWLRLSDWLSFTALSLRLAARSASTSGAPHITDINQFRNALMFWTATPIDGADPAKLRSFIWEVACETVSVIEAINRVLAFLGEAAEMTNAVVLTGSAMSAFGWSENGDDMFLEAINTFLHKVKDSGSRVWRSDIDERNVREAAGLIAWSAGSRHLPLLSGSPAGA
jgi:hypothetical protein